VVYTKNNLNIQPDRSNDANHQNGDNNDDEGSKDLNEDDISKTRGLLSPVYQWNTTINLNNYDNDSMSVNPHVFSSG
jgi:hypothetical protein